MSRGLGSRVLLAVLAALWVAPAEGGPPGPPDLPGPEVVDRVMAVVSGELILLSDVNAARELGLVRVEGAGDVEGAVLSALIDRVLILAEVDRYAPPEPPAASIDRDLQTVLARFSSRLVFDAALARAGWDEAHVRQMIRDNLRIREYEDRRFAISPPGDDDLERYYREHADAFTQDGRITPFDEARLQIAQVLADGRRAALVAEWAASLRNRASITNLYFPGR
jgi:hypothetical protein